ncbi:ABC transporter permease [Agromyces sp. SYSU T00194]|uniref:ABC transporter permease n=1 Tax=Agromyces chitinivorans TaxID=3158560 RepID=UPI00339A965A
MTLRLAGPAGDAAVAATAARPMPRWSTYLVFVPAALLALLAIFGPYLTPYDPERVVGGAAIAPNGTFWFGTDSAGMDVFSRTVAAARVDVLIATVVTLGATVIGILIGMFAGMGESHGGVRGLVARGMSRVLDLADAVPLIVIAMVIVAMFGATELSLSIVLTIVLIPGPARLTRAETLRIRGEAYLDAARIGGMREARLSLRHVLPNAAVPAVENMSVVFGVAVAIAAALGFLGVGIAPPTPEWGSMVSRGTSDLISGRWWSAVFPAIFLGAAIVSVAVAGGAAVRRLRS